MAKTGTLTIGQINSIGDVEEGFSLAEDINIDLKGLESIDDIKDRLKCHLRFMQEGAFKQKIDKNLSKLGENDKENKEKLSRMVKDVKNIFSPSDVTSTSNQQSMVESLLNLDGTTKDIRNDCDIRISSLKETECVILVAGESSAGKSSVLNLLLGEDILPAHTLPCTSCITIIKYNSQRCANVVFKNGDIKRILNLDKEGLEKLQERTYFSKDALTRQDVYQKRKEDHGIAEIQVFLPLELLRTGLVLVDTPGIGENEFLENYLIEYIRTHQILGFMYIIMVDNPLGISEDRLVNLMSLIIKSQINNTDVVKFNPKAALFICNRWDMVPKDSKATVRQNALKQLAKAWPEFDPSSVVFFSTKKAQAARMVHPGYATEDYIAVLLGLNKLVEISLDKRIKASYRWLGTVLQRSVHYLRTMVWRLDMSDRDKLKQTQNILQKLKTLRTKADTVVKQLYHEMSVAEKDICQQIKRYLQTTQVKHKLIKDWGSKPGELLDMETASGTWEWIKRHINSAFDDRLTDLLVEWDNEEEVIKTLETKVFRQAKLQLCDLESELSEVENGVRDADNLSKISNVSLVNNLCISIANFEIDEEYERHVASKVLRRIKEIFARTYKKNQDDAKLKAFTKNPKQIAEKRTAKLTELFIMDKDNRLLEFVRDFLQRPYAYIKLLEIKIPNLIQTNITLLDKFERDTADGSKCRVQYIEMMTRIEHIRRQLIEYDEDHFFASDFQADDIELIQTRMSVKKASVADLMVLAPYERNVPSEESTHGIWHELHLGKITQGSETRFVAVKLYFKNAKVENILPEVAKLRCLLHNDVCIAEFLGIYQQKEPPMPALIFAGKLMSVKSYFETKEMNVNKLLIETLVGLQYLHSKGLVHMDLTLHTLTVSENGQVKMTGACLPRTANLPPAEEVCHNSAFMYLPPEVLKGSMYFACADMYSFAILALEMKIPNLSRFSEIRKKSRSINDFLKISPKSYLEQDIKELIFPEFVIQKLLKCFDSIFENRPDAAAMSTEFTNIDKPNLRWSTATPRNIFRTFKSKK